MDNQKTQNGFVTYKWLIGTFLITIGMFLGFIYFITGQFTIALNCKVDKEVFNERTGNLGLSLQEIKNMFVISTLKLDNLNSELTKVAVRIETFKELQNEGRTNLPPKK